MAVARIDPPPLPAPAPDPPAPALAPRGRARAAAAPDDSAAPAAAGAGGDGGGGAPPQPPVTTATTGADPIAVGICVVLYCLTVAVAVLFDLKGDRPPGRPPVEGLSVFALFYVAAFVVERVMEPFVSLDKRPAMLARDRDEAINACRAAGDRAVWQQQRDTAAAKQDELDRWRANRSVVLVGVATLLGAILAGCLGLHFLSTIGAGSDVDEWQHIVVSAFVIGGGTKPLHDLITRIQKSKDNAKDPKETGGNA